MEVFTPTLILELKVLKKHCIRALLLFKDIPIGNLFVQSLEKNGLASLLHWAIQFFCGCINREQEILRIPNLHQ